MNRLENNTVLNRVQFFALKTVIILLMSAVIFSGCASNPPIPLREFGGANPAVNLVSANPDQYQGERVRWGGVIVKVANLTQATELEIIARPLDKRARPALTDHSPGRFLAISRGFLEPSVYSAGREVTVIGAIVGSSQRTIGDYQYVYPTVQVDTVYLWAKRPVYRHYHDPFWNDPWYNGYPWYPWYPRYYY